MKSKKFPVIGIAIISVIIIMLFSTTIKPTSSNPILEQAIESDSNENSVIDEFQRAIAIQLGSIVNTEVTFVESDDSALEQFLDENDLPFGSAKLLIETAVVLFDSDQKQFPSSAFLGIPQLTVTDSEGRLLDLGTVQIGFFAKFPEKVIASDTRGKAEFYLNDQLVATRYLFGQSTGETDTVLLQLTRQTITESTTLFSLTSLPTFTFTFSDEKFNIGVDLDLADKIKIEITVLEEKLAVLNENKAICGGFPVCSTFWNPRINEVKQEIIDANKKLVTGFTIKDEPSFKAILKEITSTADNVNFSWSGEFIAYELQMKIDGDKLVVLGDDNKAISIFKSDSKLNICANAQKINRVASGNSAGTIAKNISPVPVTPAIDLYFGGEKVISFVERNINNLGGSTECYSFDEIPRGLSELIIDIKPRLQCVDGIGGGDPIIQLNPRAGSAVHIDGTIVGNCVKFDGEIIILETPLSQHNYNFQCFATGGKITGADLIYHTWGIRCESNFGYVTDTGNIFGSFPA